MRREYRAFTDSLKTNGIHHRISCSSSRQQNGSAERKHRHIVKTGLTLLTNASMPLQFWDEAFGTSVYLINRLPTPTTRFNPRLKLYSRNLNMLSFEFLAAHASQTVDFNKHNLQFKSLNVLLVVIT